MQHIQNKNLTNLDNPRTASETARSSTCLKVIKISLLCLGIGAAAAAAIAAPFVMPAVVIALGVTGATLLLTALALHLFWKPESKAPAVNNNDSSNIASPANNPNPAPNPAAPFKNQILELVKELKIMNIEFSMKTENSKSTLTIGDSAIELILGGDITKEAADVIVNAANNKMLTGSGVDGAICKAGGDELALARALTSTIPGNPQIRCPTGEARITHAGNLPALFCAHAVAPNCNPGSFAAPCVSPEQAKGLLQSAYASALKAAHTALCEPDLECPIDKLEALKQNKATGPTIADNWTTFQKLKENILDRKMQLQTKRMEKTPLSISFPTLGTGIFANPKDTSSLIALIEVLKYVKEYQGKEGVKIFKFVFTARQEEDTQLYTGYLNKIYTALSLLEPPFN